MEPTNCTPSSNWAQTASHIWAEADVLGKQYAQATKALWQYDFDYLSGLVQAAFAKVQEPEAATFDYAFEYDDNATTLQQIQLLMDQLTLEYFFLDEFEEWFDIDTHEFKEDLQLSIFPYGELPKELKLFVNSKNLSEHAGWELNSELSKVPQDMVPEHSALCGEIMRILAHILVAFGPVVLRGLFGLFGRLTFCRAGIEVEYCREEIMPEQMRYAPHLFSHPWGIVAPNSLYGPPLQADEKQDIA